MPAVMMPAPPPGIGRLPTVAAPSPAPLIGRLPTATVPSPAPVIGRPVPVAPVPVTPTVPVAIPPGITLAVNPNVRKPLDVLLVQHNFRSVTADGRVTAAEGAALRSTMTQLSPEAQAEVKLRFRNSMSMFDPDARAPMQQFVNTSNALTATPAVLNFPTARPRLGGGTRLVLRADGASVTAARTGSMPEGTKKATLAWDKNNEADLAGYRVYLGSAPGVFTHVYEVASKDANSFSLEDLPAGTHFFALTAYDTTNNESAFSNAVSKTIP
jgi:hypothetical protein